MEADFVRARAERENAATRVQAGHAGNARRQMPTQQSSLGGAEADRSGRCWRMRWILVRCLRRRW